MQTKKTYIILCFVVFFALSKLYII
jgi:hypothetical protein